MKQINPGRGYVDITHMTHILVQLAFYAFMRTKRGSCDIFSTSDKIFAIHIRKKQQIVK